MINLPLEKMLELAHKENVDLYYIDATDYHDLHSDTLIYTVYSTECIGVAIDLKTNKPVFVGDIANNETDYERMIENQPEYFLTFEEAQEHLKKICKSYFEHDDGTIVGYNKDKKQIDKEYKEIEENWN